MMIIGERDKVLILRENDPMYGLSKIELQDFLVLLIKEKDQIMTKLSLQVRKWRVSKADLKKTEKEFFKICKRVRECESLIKSHT